MEENDLTILEELDNKTMVSEMIQSNLDMNHLLFQSDCILSTVESDLKTIEAEDQTIWNGNNDSILLIDDISGDLFKDLTSELNFSTPYSKIPPNDSKSIGEMFNESIQTYNTMLDANGNTKVHKHDETLINSPAGTNKISYSTPFAVEKNTATNLNEMLEDLNDSLRAYNGEFEISGCISLDDTLTDTLNKNYEISSATLVELSQCNENNNDSNAGIKHSDEDFGQKTIYQKPPAVDKLLETENSYDITELTAPKCDNRSEKQTISVIKHDTLTIEQINNAKHDNAVTSTATQPDDNNVTKQQVESLQQADEIVQTESDQIQQLKRKASDFEAVNEKTCKKIKLSTDVASNQNDYSVNKQETKEYDSDDDESLSELQKTIDGNFTMALFDPNETADNADPGWNGLRELSSSEDYFQSVRDQWRSLSLPNPHRDITRRYVRSNKHVTNNEQQLHGFQETDRSIPCVKFIDYRIAMLYERLNALRTQLNSVLGTPGSRMLRRRLNRDMDQLQITIRSLEKNREEVKQINSFYNGGNKSWNAYYLTQTQANQLEQQDKMLEFQTKYYQ